MAGVPVAGDGAGAQPGAYALFADVAKAYDQDLVWSDGLYLTLYSMGVRGAMWHIIQEWLNNARACTTWNGVGGPTVKLAKGLRQGCVLSPILYCIFINRFVAKQPVDVPLPECAVDAVASLYSQGLQGERADGEGVFSEALGRRVDASLYMDDTTLVAKTMGGLESLTRKYMQFCKRFRMRLNHKKSKVMHFRRHPQSGGGGDLLVDGVLFTQPKPHDGGRRQPYLGFLLDEAMSGMAHQDRAMAMGHSHASKVGEVSSRMGEDMGLM